MYGYSKIDHYQNRGSQKLWNLKFHVGHEHRGRKEKSESKITPICRDIKDQDTENETDKWQLVKNAEFFSMRYKDKTVK